MQDYQTQADAQRAYAEFKIRQTVNYTFKPSLKYRLKESVSPWVLAVAYRGT